jgi:uncharacterized protein (DUF1810 family)
MDMYTFNLQRFIDAQEEPMLGWVMQELATGHKIGHWMWFIFPQAYGLGESHNSKFYGIRSLEEAKKYWQHPILGERLRQCTQLVADSGKSAVEVFGKEIDAMKFQSCLTLFLQIDPNNKLLQECLDQFFVGELDEKTMEIIQKAGWP